MQVVNARDEDQAAAAIADADALFGYLTPRLLQAARKLRWVQAPTASMEKYLFPELVQAPDRRHQHARHLQRRHRRSRLRLHPVLCEEFPHLSAAAVARGLAHARPAAGELPGYGGPGEVHPSDRAALTLADCTLGVIGLGGIGAETARRGLAFGMRVLGVDPRGRPRSRRRDAAASRSSGGFAARSDFVVIAAPHTPETYKLFNRERIRQMKRSAYLINVGRGVIVDLADLTAALQAGEIAGAGLDVFETEPLPPEHPLWRMPNVIITPHCAAASPRVPERHEQTLLENLRRFVAGQPLLNVVDKRMWC